MMSMVLAALQKRSTFIFVSLMASFMLLYEYQYGYIHLDVGMVTQANESYLIYTQKCQIPNLDAWNKDAKKLYKKQSYITCSKLPLLTRIVLSPNRTSAYLIVNTELIGNYSKEGVTCCVSDVNRGNGNDIDNRVMYSPCRPIENNTAAIAADRPSRVRCLSRGRKKAQVYENVHPLFAATPRVQAKKRNFTSTRRPLSVLLLGIDSLSRLNFIRTMPKTRALLADDPNWIEFKVYNKVQDNTFPNLMAMLTGMNSSRAYAKCQPQKLGGLDTCAFIWRDFADRNYVTAYAEDSAVMSTFNYNKKGFREPPTDYYMRSHQLACKDLAGRTVDRTASYCSGPEMEGERIWRMARDFVAQFNDTPTFGFFWTNSYSHQMLNTPTRMDEVVSKSLVNLTAAAGDTSLMVFLSDHGIRFGDIRYTLTGYMEERMPMAYFRLPTWFQKEFAGEYAQFVANGNRLVTPYDVYMTFQDVLVHSGLAYNMQPAEGCPTCGSLLQTVEQNRGCAEAGIPLHYCTCNNFHPVHTEDVGLSQLAANAVINYIHGQIAERDMKQKCHNLKVREIVGTYRSMCNYELEGYYLVVVLKTKPEAVFEATLHAKPKVDSVEGTKPLATKVDLTLLPGVSRIDSYSSTEKCTSGNMQMYCICK